MVHDIRVIHIRDFVRTNVQGVVDVESTKHDLREIVQVCTERDNYHVLIDGRDADGRGLSAVDIWEVAASLEDIGFTREHRVALLVAPKDRFDRGEFFETCAANRGFTIRSFREFEKALLWLAGEAEKAG